MTNVEGRRPEGAPERSRKAGEGAASGVDGKFAKRFSVQRKMAVVARLLRGEPLELVAKGPPCQLRHPYATRSFVSIPLQEGQTKMSRSRRTPSFEIVRKCFMVSPQERHTMVGVLLGAGGERSMAAVEGV